MSEHLIRDTTCKFQALGEFRRFAAKISFIPELLWEKPMLPRILLESNDDPGSDALCRFVMQSARRDAQVKFRTKFQGSPQSFPLLATEILREGLHKIMSVLNPSAPLASGIFSSVAALASYYAWVIAFDAAIQGGFVLVLGVGSFQFVAARTGNLIDFSADEAFWKLIKVNAEKPPLPDEISPERAAA